MIFADIMTIKMNYNDFLKIWFSSSHQQVTATFAIDFALARSALLSPFGYDGIFPFGTASAYGC